MGLDYSYEIFVPARNVARTLAALAELAPRTGRVPPLEVTLPGGVPLVVPFTSNFASEPVDCSAGGTLDLDTTIMFGVDDPVRAYMEGGGRAPGPEPGPGPGPDGLGRAGIGYIYLTVRFTSAPHPRYAVLEFTAATSRMSVMFERSASVRTVFTGLAAAGGGACCVLDTESDALQVCWLNGRTLRETVPGPRFPSLDDLAATWPDQDP
ncbi:hypothetical protein OG896_20480 [Streptomyces sp. NBC_00669]|uniref:hypothetical protein n=1 Tax=Streptomyces sp. NBC_00669 TaxID=2976011 RepID=UPI002E365876|nr:hypothetical protein [Streptomyces sp. NBC_00669]